MTVYTRKGDGGHTSLQDGSRVAKSHPRLEALGAVDELNAALGLARGLVADPEVAEALRSIQEQLRLVMAEIASPDLEGLVGPGWVPALEERIRTAEAELVPQHGFILPGNGPGAGAVHLARTVCRRAERAAVRLCHEATGFCEMDAGVGQAALEAAVLVPYLNRLSDWLHILARLEAQRGLVRRISRRVQAALAAGEKGEAVMSAGLDARDCDRLVAAAEARAAAIAVPMVIAVVDDGGHLKAFKRMDGALLVSVDIAVNKAFTSAAIGLTTREVGELAQPGAALFGIGGTNGGRVVTFGGGMPLRRGGKVVGGLGVSGGSVEQDEDVAAAALAVLG